MVKPEILKIIEEEAKRSGLNFEPYREMLLQIPSEPTVADKMRMSLGMSSETMDNGSEEPEQIEKPEKVENIPKLDHLSKLDNLATAEMDDTSDSRPMTPRQEWNCSACRINFPLIHDLVIHLVTEHVHFVSKQRPRTNAAAIRCPMCVSTYLDTVESLLHHYDTTHGSRFRLFNDVKNREQMEKLIVRVNKKHINTVRAAYGDGIYATRYKFMCDEFDRVKENSDLILLKEDGPPLSALVTHFVDMTLPGKKSEFEAPNSCPLCAKVMLTDVDFFSHLQTHDSQALPRWKKAKMDMLKQEMDWKVLFRQKQKDLVRERYCTVSNQVQDMRVMADRNTEKDLMPSGPSSPVDTPSTSTASTPAPVPAPLPTSVSSPPYINIKAPVTAATAIIPTIKLGNIVRPAPPVVTYRINSGGLPKKLISVIHQTKIGANCYPATTSASQNPPKLERAVSAGADDLRVEAMQANPPKEATRVENEIRGQLADVVANGSPILAEPRRVMKRRDLVATNRNARAKPLTAQKLLSLSCMRCGLVFENRCKYTRHLLDHKNEANPYRCIVKGCLMSYDNANKLRSHIYRKHCDVSEDHVEAACDRGDSVMKRKGPIQLDYVDFDSLRPSCSESITVHGSIDVGQNAGGGISVKDEEIQETNVGRAAPSTSTSQVDFVNGQLVFRDVGEMNTQSKEESNERVTVKQEPLDEDNVPTPTTRKSSVHLHLSGSPMPIKEEDNSEEQQNFGRSMRKRKATATFSP